MSRYEIVDRRTGKRVSMGSWFTEESALNEISGWIDRYHRGGRPDISIDLLLNMVPREVSDE